ncbi:MAG: hypothetical protein J2P32_14925 [Actinobacteria bacterium]|nr:hypothetical protein [Actinomycetota bacterium]
MSDRARRLTRAVAAAVLLAFPLGGTVCVAFVTTGPTQAFTFSAASLRGEKGEDMCGVTRRFAAAVFAHVGPP